MEKEILQQLENVEDVTKDAEDVEEYQELVPKEKALLELKKHIAEKDHHLSELHELDEKLIKTNKATEVEIEFSTWRNKFLIESTESNKIKLQTVYAGLQEAYKKILQVKSKINSLKDQNDSADSLLTKLLEEAKEKNDQLCEKIAKLTEARLQKTKEVDAENRKIKEENLALKIELEAKECLLKMLEDENNDLPAKSAELKTKLNYLDEEYEKINKEQDNLKAAYHESGKNNHEEVLNKMKERLNAAISEGSNLRQTVNDKEIELNNFVLSYNALDEQNKIISENLKVAKNSLEEIKQQKEIQAVTFNEKIQTLKPEVESKQQKLLNSKTEMLKNTELLENKKNVYYNLLQNVEELNSNLKNVDNSYKALNETNNSLIKGYEKLVNEQAETLQKMSLLKSTIESKTQEETNLQLKCNEEKSSHDKKLKELIDVKREADLLKPQTEELQQKINILAASIEEINEKILHLEEKTTNLKMKYENLEKYRIQNKYRNQLCSSNNAQNLKDNPNNNTSLGFKNNDNARKTKTSVAVNLKTQQIMQDISDSSIEIDVYGQMRPAYKKRMKKN